MAINLQKVEIIMWSSQKMLHIPSWFPGAYFKRWARKAYTRSKKFTNTSYDIVKSKMKKGEAIACFMTQALESVEEETRNTPTDEEENIIDIIKYAAASIYAKAQAKAQEKIDHIVGFLQDDEYHGYHIPKHAWVMANSWAIRHDSITYPDPEKFNPDHFMHTSKSEPQIDPRKFSFGYGRWRCPGIHFANSSIFLTVAQTLVVFNILKPLNVTGCEYTSLLAFMSGHVSHSKHFNVRIEPCSQKVWFRNIKDSPNTGLRSIVKNAKSRLWGGAPIDELMTWVPMIQNSEEHQENIGFAFERFGAFCVAFRRFLGFVERERLQQPPESPKRLEKHAKSNQYFPDGGPMRGLMAPIKTQRIIVADVGSDLVWSQLAFSTKPNRSALFVLLEGQERRYPAKTSRQQRRSTRHLSHARARDDAGRIAALASTRPRRDKRVGRSRRAAELYVFPKPLSPDISTAREGDSLPSSSSSFGKPPEAQERARLLASGAR
ncbi:cytochrome P450 [Obba rivulosa]|uniref:Cytochrome P450 n=1 Tax=Obba rivulosa TaxID=1052685 RepID=A0A8E2DL86_9APHY|nr:cytochrome P450 [Obba rivulosa]